MELSATKTASLPWHLAGWIKIFQFSSACTYDRGSGLEGVGGSSNKEANIFCRGRGKYGTIIKLATIKKEVYLSHKNSRKENPVII